MSSQGYYQQGGPQYPQNSYQQPYPQQGYGPPPQQYGGYPQGGMQYQQGPPQQVVVQKKQNQGCFQAWYVKNQVAICYKKLDGIHISQLSAVVSLRKNAASVAPTAVNAAKCAVKSQQCQHYR